MPFTERDKRELDQRKAASDVVMAERHSQWDLSAQDQHAKSERFHFAVVGEGSKTAQERYRKNYDTINWRE